MKKAVFLDKDGTLIPDIPYNIDPSLIRLSEHSVEGLKRLQRQGFLFFIISNQPGIAFNYYSEAELGVAFDCVGRLLSEHGISLVEALYCPHHPEGSNPDYTRECPCRKPMPGLFYRAAENYGIDLSGSWMIGDILNDVEAGNRAGCRTILIDNGNETEWVTGPFREPDLRVDTINEAAAAILHLEEHRQI